MWLAAVNDAGLGSLAKSCLSRGAYSHTVQATHAACLLNMVSGGDGATGGRRELCVTVVSEVSVGE